MIIQNGSDERLNSILDKPIEQSLQLLQQITQFINKVNKSPNYVFDNTFSIELDFFKNELEFLVKSLEITI